MSNVEMTRGFVSESKERRNAIIFLGAVFLLTTSLNLNIQTIANPDEPRYAVAAREMLRGGDPIVPVFNAEPRLVKPILFYWLLAAAGAIGKLVGMPLSEGFRLEPLLMGLVVVITTYLLGRKLLNHRGALIASLILISTNMFHNLSRELISDMTLTTFFMLAWYAFYAAIEKINEKKPSGVALLGFYTCAGLACLTKGPFLVGLFLALPIFIWLLWTRQFKMLTAAGLWWGVPLAAALGMWWFIAVAYHGQNANFFFSPENLQRFVGNKDHQHPVPFLYYIINLGESFAPWSIVLPFVGWWTLQYVRRNTLSHRAKLLVCATIVPFVILGISISKRHIYLLPLYPFLALWIGAVWYRVFMAFDGDPATGWRGKTGWAVGLCLSSLLVAAAFVVPKFGGQGRETIFGLALALLALALAVFVSRSLAGGMRTRASIGFALMAATLGLGSELIVRPIRERNLRLEAFYDEVNSKVGGRAVVLLGLSSNETVWYLDRPNEPIDDVTLPELKARLFETPGVIMLVASTHLTPEMQAAVDVVSDKMIRQYEAFLLVKPKPGVTPPASLFEKRPSPSGRIHSIFHRL